ncbi:Restriction endonuclease S subunit [Hyella patelloides LEGE 07179]|uniref:Restriction endonuclease S subunit n=1 Tax=Hyella patelloides LEGE 07179 TaxID=945734 RepID=A0A563VRI0_9CYAN|nr:hypothetical protein [Hyella patelloides]VEP13980.1 Restriction endonuclease S subunit [Hyella patelloides LEGE 07179]
MAVWSIIDYQDTPGKRFDPEYYQPEYLELANHLSKIDTVFINDFAYVTDGIHGSPDFVEENGISYLLAKCLGENYINISNASLISEQQHQLNPRTQACVGDVLLTTIGTVGKAAVVSDGLLPANLDRNLGIIRIKNTKEVSPYYLATFLNCKFGLFQTVREATGNVQPALFIDKIKKIVVPTGDKFNEIGKLTKLAYDKRRESEALSAEAEQLLLQELGLDNLDLSPQTSYVANFDETIEAKRIDAEYFQPKYQIIVDHLLSNYEVKSLEELGKVTKGRSATYSEVGIPIIRSGDLTDLDSLNSLKYADSGQSLFYLKKYDVCISSIGFGSIGKVQLFDRDDKFATVSEVTV